MIVPPFGLAFARVFVPTTIKYSRTLEGKLHAYALGYDCSALGLAFMHVFVPTAIKYSRNIGR